MNHSRIPVGNHGGKFEYKPEKIVDPNFRVAGPPLHENVSRKSPLVRSHQDPRQGSKGISDPR